MSMTAVIRRATSADLPGLLALQALCHPPALWDSADEIARAIMTHFYVCAEADGRVVGAGSAHVVGPPDRKVPVWHIYDIEVLEDERRNGVGRAIVDALCAPELVPRETAGLVSAFAVHADGARLLLRAGFRINALTLVEGLPAIVMGRTVDT